MKCPRCGSYLVNECIILGGFTLWFILMCLLFSACSLDPSMRRYPDPPPEFWASSFGLVFHPSPDPVLGDLETQIADIRSLGVTRLRIPAYDEPAVWETWDQIAAASAGLDVLAVLTPAGPWDCEEHITNFFLQFIARYDDVVSSYELLDEWDHFSTCSVEQYALMWNASIPALRALTSKPITASSTLSIQKNFPETFLLNQTLYSLIDSGSSNFFSLHWYGKQLEKYWVIAPWVKGLGIPIWMTEFGSTGLEGQRDYLNELVAWWGEDIQRAYWYSYAGNDGFGLVQVVENQRRESDLYRMLKERGS